MFKITRSSLTLFGLSLRWYGILIALGVFCAVVLACRRESRLGLKKDTTLDLALICVPVAIICARLYYVAFSWDYYSAHPAQILAIRQGGLAIYGGVIGGVCAGWIYCRVKKISFFKGLDLVAPSLALGQAIGRWGNFLNQEAYGEAVLNSRLQFFPVAVQIEGVWHYATFFYESLWCAVIVALILLAEKKGFFRRDGDLFAAYLMLYGLERALVEGLRTDSLYWGNVRVSQMLSIVLVVIAVLAFALQRGRLKIYARLIPVLLALMLGVLLTMECNVAGLIVAALLPVITAILYIRNNPLKCVKT